MRLPQPGQVASLDFATFDWNDVIKSIDLSIENMGDEGFRLIQENKSVPSFAVHDASVIPQVSIMKNWILSQRRIPSGFSLNCHLYASMSGDAGAFGMHNDVDDVYIWQVRGTTNWIIPEYDFKESLMPGDFIYIPNGVDHSPELTGPRISVSFSIGM